MRTGKSAIRQTKSLRYSAPVIRQILRFGLFLCFAHVASSVSGESASNTFPVTVTVHAEQRVGDWKPIWRFFGYDEPNFTYMPDGKKLLTELSQLGAKPVYVRTHHLLSSGDGTPALKWGSTGIYTEGSDGRPIYSFTIVDRIFDTYLQRGLKPLVELGFMPEVLSTRPDLYPKITSSKQRIQPGAGFSYPPKDYGEWGELCHAWARHCVQKYGRAEVKQWYWEVWNEPNISYWKGTPAEYHKLYDYAVDGVRRALPTARVGGPHTAGGPGGNFLRDFIEHCLHGTNYATGKTGSPLDFVAFHAKGSPRVTDGNVVMGLANQMRNINDACAVIASFPELEGKPVIIGESDPEGCAACPASETPANGYRNTSLYATYTAASFARKPDIAARHGVNLEGALTWAFEFEDQPWFAGFRVLASNGVDLPVLNAFRMFGQMGHTRMAAESSCQTSLDTVLRDGVRGKPDVGVVATSDARRLAILLWHYQDEYVPGRSAQINLAISGLPAEARSALLTHYRIDDEHSNSYELWRKFGSPQKPSPEQRLALEQAGQLGLLMPPAQVQIRERAAELQLELPLHAVSLLNLQW